MLEASWLPGAQEKKMVFAALASITSPEVAIFPCRFSVSNLSELQYEELTRTIDHIGTRRVWLSEAFALQNVSEEKLFFFLRSEQKKKGALFGFRRKITC